MSKRTPEEIQERISNIVTTEIALGIDASTPWWWLSYAGDAEGFMGVCVVQANSMGGAVFRAKDRHISPGGQVLGAEIPAGALVHFPERYRNRCLSKAEAEWLNEPPEKRKGDGP